MGFFSEMANNIKKNQSAKTAYQQNLSQPVQQKQESWYAGNVPTTSEIYGRIQTIGKTDPMKAQQIATGFAQAQQDKSSPWYAPYTQPTNQAVGVLKSYGIDPDTLTDEWFQQNNGWKSYLRYSAATNGVLSPTKKSTTDEIIAYNINEYQESEAKTKKAEQEWAALQQELAYKAGDKARNYSDEEILNSVDWNKYSTLKEMKESLAGAKTVRLNRAVDFSDDAMRGVLWAARNGGSSGSIYSDMAASALGEGTQWKDDPELRAKLDWNNKDTYAPYSVGMTLDPEVGLYFNVYEINQETLDDLRTKLDPNDKTDMEMYTKAVKAFEATQEAEAEKARLDAKIDKWVNAGYSYEKIQDKLDTELAKTGKNGYPTLRDMDESIANGSKLVETTKAINYSRNEVNAKIQQMIDARALVKTGDDKIAEMTDTKTAEEIDKEANALLDEEKKTGQEIVGKDVQIFGEKPQQEEEKAQPVWSDHWTETTNEATERFVNSNPDAEGKTPMRSADELKKAYDAKHGSGAYDAAMTAANTPREKSAQEQADEVNSVKFAVSVDALADRLTPKQLRTYDALPQVNGSRLAESFYKALNGTLIQGPASDNLKNPEWVARMATKNADKADRDYMTTVLGNMSFRNEYEKAQTESRSLWAKYDKYAPFYEAAALSEQETPKNLQVTIEGTDIPLVFTMNSEGRYEFRPSNNIDFENNLAVQEYLSNNGMTMDDLTLKIREENGKANERADSARAARENMETPVLSASEIANMPTQEELETIRKQATNIDRYLTENQERYNQARADNEKANNRRMRAGDITLRESGIAVDPKVSDAVIDFVGGFGDWQRPADGYDSLIEDLRNYYGTNKISGQYDMDAIHGKQVVELRDYVSALDEDIKSVEFVLDSYDNIPQEYREQMQDWSEWAKSRIRQYEAFALSLEDNFDTLVNDGKGIYWNTVIENHDSDNPNALGTKPGWGQMTDTEQNIYYALCAAKGIEAADQFYADIEGSLLTRTQENIRAGIQETAQSGVAGRVFAEIASIGMSGIEVPANLLYLAGTALNGEGNKWLRIPSTTAQQANHAVIAQQKEIYKGTIFESIIPNITEMVNNRGRSAVVGQVFGPLMPDGAGDIFNAMPIATIAMGDAIEAGKEAGLEDWQVWTLGAVNFMAESVTEGIKFGHIDEAINGMSAATLKEFLLDKVKGLDWLEEATGETLNNVVERWANYFVAGDQSDHAKKVQELLDSGVADDEKQAWQIAFGDYISEDIHTAIVSALGSFMDVGFFAASKAADTISYAKQVDSLRRMGDTKTTIKDLRNRDIAYIHAVNDLKKVQAQAEAETASEESQTQEEEKQTEVGFEEAVNPEVEQQLRKEYDLDMTILDNANDGDQTSKTSTIAAVMRTDGRNGNQSLAAAAEMVGQNGEQTIESLGELLQGGLVSNTNINKLKLGLQYAMLGDGECRRVMNSDAYKNADPAQKAVMLSNATLVDATNSDVKGQVDNAVHETRVNLEEQRLMAERSDELEAADKAAAQAEQLTTEANKKLENQRSIENATAEATRRAGEAVAQDASRDNINALNHAVTEQENQAKVTQEYQQSADNAQRDEQGVREESERRKDAINAEIRQQAEANVGQMEQQEAEQTAKELSDAEQQRREQLEQRRQQVLQDQRSGKLEEESNEAKIRRYVADKGLVGEEAENLIQDLVQFSKDRTMGKIDMTKTLSDSEGMLMMGALERRFGLKVNLADTPDGVNGYYDGASDTVVLNKNLTGGQVLVEFALHELTHSLEQTGHYQQYSDTVMNALFPSDAEKQKAIADMMATREAAGYPVDEAQAQRELVAEFTRTRLNDKAMIERMVDAGIGGRIRNALHNINQFLKNKKLGEAEQVQAENLRRAERLFQKAIVDREKAQKKQEWLGTENTATGQNENSVAGELTDAQKAQAIKEANADYMSAIERGDSQAAQEDVDFAAAQAGYTDKAYHGTNSFGFTEFNGEDGYTYVAYDPSMAGTYSATGENIRNVAEGMSVGFRDMSNQQIVDYLNAMDDGRKRAFKAEGYSFVNAELNEDGDIRINLEDGYGDTFTHDEFVSYALNEDPFISENSGVYSLYTKPTKQLVIDAHGDPWNGIHYVPEGMEYINDDPVRKRQGFSTRELASIAEENGYDSIRINNVFDHGRWHTGNGVGDIGIFFNNNDLKSADTVTYDNDGNIIPLTERFTSNPDIRYSAGGNEMTDAERTQALVDAGVVSKEEAKGPRLQFEGLTEAENDILSQSLKPGDKGNAQRQWGQKGAQQSDEIDQQVKDYLLKNNMYTRDTNVKQIERALKWIRSFKTAADPDGYYEAMMKVTGKRFNSNTPDGQARMVALMGMAAAKGDLYGQVTLADAYNRQGTLAGQTLQSRKLFRLMTPEGRIATLQKMLGDIQTQVENRGGDPESVKFSDWIYRAAAAAKTEDEFSEVRDAAAAELGEQIPANWHDKLVGFRMLAMLGNPRTHIRNLGGNAIFMPFVGVKNKVAAALEAAFVKEGERTKTLGLATPEARQFAKEYSKDMEDVLRGEAKYNDQDKAKQNMKIWGQGDGIISKTLGKFLQAYSDVNGKALEGEDWIFLRRHFRNALAGYMTANKLTVADMKGDTLMKATEYAVNEAQKATYRDPNSVASALSNIAKKYEGEGTKELGAKAIQGVLNAVVPFKKTPANILRRGFEYSPIGLGSAVKDIKAMVETVRFQEGKTDKAPKRLVTPAQFIDKIASGLTGSAVMALGMAMARAGFARGGMDYDDPEDLIAMLRGEQEYGVNFGKTLNSLFGVELFGEDVSYTMDWAAPMSMPFFVGVTLNDLFEQANSDKNKKDFWQKFQGAVEGLLSITEPVFNLSMLDGVNRLFKTNTYGSKNPALDVVFNIALNYASSYVPTVIGQVARHVDPTRRATYVESGAFLTQFWKTVEQVQNKIPYASKSNIPYLDAFGRDQTTTKLKAALENFFSPGYVSELKNDDAVINEIERVYKATKNEKFIPETAVKSFNVGDTPHKLTDKEYEAFQKDQGETWYKTIDDLIKSTDYQNADDATKAMMLEDARTYALQTAKYHIDNKFGAKQWVLSAMENGNVTESIVNNAKEANWQDFLEDRSAQLAKALDEGDEESADTLKEALEQANIEEGYKFARKAITKYFKPIYQKAAEEEDGEETMDRIEDILMELDYGYRESDIHKWASGESEEEEDEEERESDSSRWLNRD